MDRDRRYNLRSVVGKCRRIIEDDISKRLMYYGITNKAEPIPVENLKHLSVEDKEVKIKLEKAIEKEKCAVTNYQKAVDRYIRHVGFTFINRIAALRAMEVRELIIETILRKSEYGGMSLRERGIHEKNHDLTPDQVLEESLKDAFREVTKEIKVLFDLESEYSIVFPNSKALRDIIQLLSGDVTEDDWLQDDIIGWIYQYYNEEARKEYRKSGRNPTVDDIPVINQFYTPHWVVRVLTDNTLGRLWLEQQDRYPYLVNNNNEIQLVEKRQNIPNNSKENEFKNWLKSSEGETVDQFCSYIIPLINGFNEREDKKKAREIKVLDPACGSGHFLIYAFDVLFRIYLEDEPETPVEDIPNLILENNLFGIDIDLRAVQLAALSIFLKAKSYNPNIEINRLNLICADSHIAIGEKRNRFLERFSHIPPLQEIFAKTFEDLNNTNELGSLLKVKEPFEKLFVALDDSETNSYLEGGIGQSVLSNKGIIPQTRFQKNKDEKTYAVTKVLTINEMFQELRMFEQEAMERQDMGSILFATEAEKSIGLLSLLTQDYDVILMNPPYGKMPEQTKTYLEKNYPRTKNDLYAAFIEMTINLNEYNGFIGMLTSRTFMFLKTFQKLREDILWNEGIPELFLDTGFGILDGATVETAAVVLKKSNSKKQNDTERKICTFCKLYPYGTDYKETTFRNSILNYLNCEKDDLWFRVTFGDLKLIPGMSYAYWASSTLIGLFIKQPPLDKDVLNVIETKIADVKQGLATADDARFTRRFWELYPGLVNNNKDWVPFSKGEKLVRFFYDIDLVVNWKENGLEIRNFPKSRPQNGSFYFKEGLTYCYSTPNGFGIRYLPKNCIFGHKASLISPNTKENDDKWKLLGFLASNLTFLLKLMINPTRTFEVGQIASLPVYKNYSESLILGNLAHEAHDLLKNYSTGNETSTMFIKPWILQVLDGFNSSEMPKTGHVFVEQFEWANWDSLKEIRNISGSNKYYLKELSELCIKREEIANERLEELQNLIDGEVYRILEISDEDQELVRKELELKNGLAKSKVGFNVINNDESILEHVKRLISYYAKLTIEGDEDGIVTIEQLTNDVKKRFVDDFGQNKLNIIEKELYEILGKSLKEWFANDYFDYHLQMYKNRPIYWQLTSSKGKGRTSHPAAYSCFVNYHKLDRDIIPKLISFYLKPEIEIAIREKDRIQKELERLRIEGNRKKVSGRSKDREQAANLVEELESFELALNKIHNPREDKIKLPKKPKWVQVKIKEVRDEGWNPVIDYGVRVNIEPLKEAQILPKSADKVK